MLKHSLFCAQKVFISSYESIMYILTDINVECVSALSIYLDNSVIPVMFDKPCYGASVLAIYKAQLLKLHSM